MSPWYVAFRLAIDDGTLLNSLSDANKTLVTTGNKIQNFKDKYQDLFGKPATAIAEGVAYAFKSYGASGNIFETSGHNAATSEQVTFYANGWVEDRSTDTSDPNAIVTWNGVKYYKVKVLENDVQSFVGKAYYVQLDDNKTINPDHYYLLYTWYGNNMHREKFGTPIINKVQLTANYDDVNSRLDAMNGSTQICTANLSADDVKTFSNPNEPKYVKVGDNYIAVTKRYNVQNGDHAGKYYVKQTGEMYKSDAAIGVWEDIPADEALSLNLSGTPKYVVAEAVTADVQNSEAQTLLCVKIGESKKINIIPEDDNVISGANPTKYLEDLIAAGTIDAEEQAALDQASRQKEQEYNTAVSNTSDAQTAVTNATTQLGLDEQALADALAVPTKSKGYTYGGNNEDLVRVELNNDIIYDFGEFAFANCIKAEFFGNVLPTTTKTIGKCAFLNTLIKPSFTACNPNIESIGSWAFEGTKTDVVDLTNATKLTDMGTDVFQHCALTWVNLTNTPLTEIPSGIAQKLAKQEVELTTCASNGATAQAPSTPASFKANVNTSLLGIALPKGITSIPAGTFFQCINLYDVAVPAGVTSIGEWAFAWTSVPQFDLSAVTGLETVGDYAFAFNDAL